MLYTSISNFHNPFVRKHISPKRMFRTILENTAATISAATVSAPEVSAVTRNFMKRKNPHHPRDRVTSDSTFYAISPLLCGVYRF